MKHLFLALLLTIAAAATTLAADPARTLLTASTLSKLKAVEAELSRAGVSDTDDADDADDADATVEQIARKIDRSPAAKAALARQGLTGMDFALYSHAIFHAASFLLFEKSLERRKANELLAGYTPEQRANIETLRKFAHVKP